MISQFSGSFEQIDRFPSQHIQTVAARTLGGTGQAAARKPSTSNDASLRTRAAARGPCLSLIEGCPPQSSLLAPHLAGMISPVGGVEAASSSRGAYGSEREARGAEHGDAELAATSARREAGGGGALL